MLTLAFDLTAEAGDKQPELNPGMKVTGTGKIYRSLNDRANLVWQLKGKVSRK